MKYNYYAQAIHVHLIDAYLLEELPVVGKGDLSRGNQDTVRRPSAQ